MPVPVTKLKMGVKELVMCVLIGAALCGIGLIAGSGIDYFLLPADDTELDSLLLSSDICWRVLCVGIIAPVVEEIVFREYLISFIAPYSEKNGSHSIRSPGLLCCMGISRSFLTQFFSVCYGDMFIFAQGI